MVHATPTKVLLATTLQPLVVQLSGSLAHGAHLIDRSFDKSPPLRPWRRLSTL
jgi:hypothetical protein